MARAARKEPPILPKLAFDDSYKPVPLGCGSYGSVETVKYRGEICAAKQIHLALIVGAGSDKENILDRFLQECNRCSNIIHENIVRFYGVYYPPKRPNIPSMVMELMDKSLTNFIFEENPSPSWTIKLSLLSDAATGLSYLHALSPPIIHRDLSPNNILLKQNPAEEKERWVAKIADFGMSKVVQPGKLTNTPIPGTPVFMPPEAFEANPHYTTSLDVFSYGGVVLFVATHEWPTPEQSKEAVSGIEQRRQYLDKIPRQVRELKPMVTSCMNDDKNGRPTMKHISKVWLATS